MNFALGDKAKLLAELRIRARKGHAMFRLTVGGDAEGGWLVDIHDGDTIVVLTPEGASAAEAAVRALLMHCPELSPPANDTHQIEPDAA